jgi:peptidoglycan/xylan/chitin deacetylase (PgdA/CDA1 family)
VKTPRKPYTHSVMFHHFHDDQHPVGQGSLSSREFDEMIGWLADRHRILDAAEYTARLEKRTLSERVICLSFDDALLCQAAVAVPVLEQRNIKAFFFLYSSPFCGDPDPLEIYRYFRTTGFESMGRFYEEFFAETRARFPQEYEEAKRSFDANTYLAAFPFYTSGDRWFRFLRDKVLGKARYDSIMEGLMAKHRFDVVRASARLWMSDEHIRSLNRAGHIVGLHSYSHPTEIHRLSAEEQRTEYAKNFEHLAGVLGEAPAAMSHPCGNYNDDTLRILEDLGIRIGFRSNTSVTGIRSNLEVPRDDHSNVFKEMKA